MEEFFGYLLVYLFVELIFWGFLYGTGCLIVPLISFGQCHADPLLRETDGPKRARKQTGMKLIRRSGKIYLGACAVSFLGLGFWVLVIAGLIIL